MQSYHKAYPSRVGILLLYKNILILHIKTYTKTFFNWYIISSLKCTTVSMFITRIFFVYSSPQGLEMFVIVSYQYQALTWKDAVYLNFYNLSEYLILYTNKVLYFSTNSMLMI